MKSTASQTKRYFRWHRLRLSGDKRNEFGDEGIRRLFLWFSVKFSKNVKVLVSASWTFNVSNDKQKYSNVSVIAVHSHIPWMVIVCSNLEKCWPASSLGCSKDYFICGCALNTTYHPVFQCHDLTSARLKYLKTKQLDGAFLSWFLKIYGRISKSS